MRRYHPPGKRIRRGSVPPPRAGMGAVAACALILLLWLFLMPLIFLTGGQAAPDWGTASDTEPLPAAPLPVAPEQVSAPAGDDGAGTLRVRMADGTVETMQMAEYLWRVVAAEMPAAFESEALKAQAVAARTYAVRKLLSGEPKHPDADVCGDITCCQAYITPEAAYEIWSNSAAFYYNKIAAAVLDTDGLVITYDGEPIDAVFHSSSVGRTADAVEVWGTAVPYLVSVESPEGEEVPNYNTVETLEPEDFRQLFLEQYPGARLTGDPSNWFQNPTYSASGAVATIDVGGVTVKGTALRTLCALRSAHFTVQAGAEGISFHVTAYGHGVGMSQYGANALAKEGRTYTEILKWYYTRVEVEPYLPQT